MKHTQYSKKAKKLKRNPKNIRLTQKNQGNIKKGTQKSWGK